MTVNFGIIGYGKMASICHKPILDKLPGAKLLAVWDLTESRREAARADGIERVYSSLSDLLNDQDVPVVVICTPSHKHVSIGIRAAKAGKHILTEKPAARTTAEWKKLVTAARRCGVVLSVFHNRRWDQDFMAARKIIRQKLVGEVIAVEARWQGYGSAAPFGIKDYNQKWREMKRFGGGTLLDLGVHMLDQINQITTAKPDQVTAVVRGGVWAADCDDYASGMVHFDDGMVAFVEASAITKVQLPRYRILGTKGMAVHNAEKKTMDIYLGNTDKPTKSICIDKPNTWNEVYRGLIAAVKDRRKKPAVTPESVITTLQLIDAYRDSSRTGRSVAIRGPREK